MRFRYLSREHETVTTAELNARAIDAESSANTNHYASRSANMHVCMMSGHSYCYALLFISNIICYFCRFDDTVKLALS